MNKKTSIGGSALIEGVMMRGPLVTAMAVRHVSGEIRTEQWNEDTTKRPLILKIPIVRGVYAFISSLALSYKCLMKSAAMSGLEEEDDGKTAAKPDAMPVKNAQAEDNTQAQSGGGTPEGNNAPTEDAAPRQNALANPEGGAESGVSQEDVLSESGASIQENTVSMESRVETAPAAPSASPAAVTAAEAAAKKEKESKLYTLLLALAVAVGTVLGTALAVGLFIFVPVMLSGLIPFLKDNYIPRAVFEGMVRLVVFVLYVWAIAFMKDIKRMFSYHGAEHKTIFCYEHGLPLTVENVRVQKRFHPRCGTSFMVLMIIVGIIVSMFIHIDTLWLRMLVKIAVLPVVIGIGYELIRLAGKYDNILTRIISAPGLWVQRLTTKEPDDSMIECAVAAMTPVIPADPTLDEWGK